MTKSNSGREKHSYVPFYMDDWQGGTAGMTRMIKSVYFDVCLFNWDKAKPMTPSHLSLITQDLQEMAQPIIDLLVETDKIVLDPARGYYSPRALSVGEKAFEVWSAKSAGGKKGGRGRGEDDSTPSNTASGKMKDTSSKPASMVQESDHIQNQNQNQNHLAATAAKGGGDVQTNEVEEDAEALARIEAAARVSEELRLGVVQITDTWNAMAVTVGLPQVSRMTDERMDEARALVAEFTADKISDVIRAIPDSPFLMGGGEKGWRIKFDWMLKPDNFVGMKDGEYHDGKMPEAKPKAAPKPKPPIPMQDDPDNPRQVKLFREKLKSFVGDAVYAATFEQGTAVYIVDGRLLDLYFRDAKEQAITQASFEGAVMAAAAYINCSLRWKTLADVPKAEDPAPAEQADDEKLMEHIDTEQNEADMGVLEGKP